MSTEVARVTDAERLEACAREIATLPMFYDSRDAEHEANVIDTAAVLTKHGAFSGSAGVRGEPALAAPVVGQPVVWMVETQDMKGNWNLLTYAAGEKAAIKQAENQYKCRIVPLYRAALASSPQHSTGDGDDEPGELERFREEAEHWAEVNGDLVALLNAKIRRAERSSGPTEAFKAILTIAEVKELRRGLLAACPGSSRGIHATTPGGTQEERA